MKKNYIVLLQNNYVLFFLEKPTKKGNYLNEVRLFEVNEDLPSKEICKWVKSKYKSANLIEVEDWE